MRGGPHKGFSGSSAGSAPEVPYRPASDPNGNAISSANTAESRHGAADNCLRLDKDLRPEYRGKQLVQPTKEQPIPIGQLDTSRQPAAQHDQLLPQRGVLCSSRALDLNNEVRMARAIRISAIIAVDASQIQFRVNRIGFSVRTSISCSQARANRASAKREIKKTGAGHGKASERAAACNHAPFGLSHRLDLN